MVRVKVHDDTCVRSDAFHRLTVAIGCTCGPCEQAGNACTGADLLTANHSFYMRQSGTLDEGQAGKLKSG